MGVFFIAVGVLAQFVLAVRSMVKRDAHFNTRSAFLYRLAGFFGGAGCLIQIASTSISGISKGAFFLPGVFDRLSLSFLLLFFCCSFFINTFKIGRLPLLGAAPLFAVVTYGTSSLFIFALMIMGLWLFASGAKTQKGLIPALAGWVACLVSATPAKTGWAAWFVPAVWPASGGIFLWEGMGSPLAENGLICVALIPIMTGMALVLHQRHAQHMENSFFILLASAQSGAYFLMRISPHSPTSGSFNPVWGWLPILAGIGFLGWVSLSDIMAEETIAEKEGLPFFLPLLLVAQCSIFAGLGTLFAHYGQGATVRMVQAALLYVVFGFSFLSIVLPTFSAPFLSVPSLVEGKVQLKDKAWFYGIILFFLLSVAIFLCVVWLSIQMFALLLAEKSLTRVMAGFCLFLWGFVFSYGICRQLFYWVSSRQKHPKIQGRSLADEHAQGSEERLHVHASSIVNASWFFMFLASWIKKPENCNKCVFYTGSGVLGVLLLTPFFWEWLAWNFESPVSFKQSIHMIPALNWQVVLSVGRIQTLSLTGIIVLLGVSSVCVVHKIIFSPKNSVLLPPLSPLWDDGRDPGLYEEENKLFESSLASADWLHIRLYNIFARFLAVNARFIKKQHYAWRAYLDVLLKIAPSLKDIILLLLVLFFVLVGIL